MTRPVYFMLFTLAGVALAGAQAPEPREPHQPAQPREPPATLYLELWQPSPVADEIAPAEEPHMLVAVGRPTVSAPLAGWCTGLRDHGASAILPEILLRGAPYDRFATDTVPLLLEVLIDDIEMRYALGTERPDGTTGINFPFFELCPMGFGSREAEGWVLDVLHVSNHRGDSVALGVYKGTLSESERAYLEAQLGYPVDLPDPAGLLLLGSDREIDTLLLVESPSSEAFDTLRARIMR